MAAVSVAPRVKVGDVKEGTARNGVAFTAFTVVAEPVATPVSLTVRVPLPPTFRVESRTPTSWVETALPVAMPSTVTAAAVAVELAVTVSVRF